MREPAPTRSQNRDFQKSFQRDREDRRGDGESGGFRENRRFRDNDDRNQIFVGGLPQDMSEENIRGVFSKFGTVRHVRMNQNTNSRPGAGFGFVTFSSPQEAQNALQERDSIYFNNLQVNYFTLGRNYRHDKKSFSPVFKSQNLHFFDRHLTENRLISGQTCLVGCTGGLVITPGKWFP